MLTVTGLPIFNDNYIWLLLDSQRRCCYAVDPGEAAAVESFCRQGDWRLAGILVTHHHADHTGGVVRLSDWAGCQVYGPAAERISGITQPLREGAQVALPGCSLTVMETPGHTAGHISYFGDRQEQAPVLFCGDTLFAGGCGRLFEGSPAQMLASLQRLASLPATTLVYCAHEYTQANLAFARLVEPGNARLVQRQQAVQQLRRQGRPSVPSVLQDELDTNPFLRTTVEAVRRTAGDFASRAMGSNEDVFAVIRRWKDSV